MSRLLRLRARADRAAKQNAAIAVSPAEIKDLTTIIMIAKDWFDAVADVKGKTTPGSPADQFIKAYEEFDGENYRPDDR